jgi:RNA 2',3'-cyclic 3'-phosphodiesterase
MARIRTFIAVELAHAVKNRMASLQEELTKTGGGVKWVSVENMHLTLLFLGEVEKLDVVNICRVVQKRSRKHQAFTLEVEGLGAFPNMRRPKILWAGITDGVEPLKALHADLEEGLLDLGCYRREDRGYTPHLTLGRLQRDEGEETWSSVVAGHSSWRGGTTPVAEVLVMSSEMRREGPQYSVIGRAPLGS